jgi:DNA-binding NtrC family response regulator
MPESAVTPISLDDRLRELETALITWALRMTGGNKSQAAALLKIKRSTLGDRINRCGLGRARGGSVASDRREPAA